MFSLMKALFLLLIPIFGRSEFIQNEKVRKPKDFNTESQCEDSPLTTPFQGGISCTDIEISYCSLEVVKSHCPAFCNACIQYGCADSLAEWYLNGIHSCSKLASLEESKIETRCAQYPELPLTCNLSCGYCSTVSPAIPPSFTPSSSPTFESIKIVAPDGVSNDWFGKSVAISDELIVVGSWRDDGSGSAYFYTIGGLFIQKVTAPDATIGARFGKFVDVSGDLVVIGAPGENGMGAAYLYLSIGSFVQKLTAPDASSGDNFGRCVCVFDNTVVVGAIYDDNNGISRTGSAYVYSSNGSFITKLIAPDATAHDYFGRFVYVYNDIIAIGAPYKNNSMGAVYLYSSDGTFINKIIAPDGAAGDRFGWSISISNNIIVVGAIFDGDNGDLSGSVYFYSTNGSFLQKLIDPDGAAGDLFGRYVCVSDDIIVIAAGSIGANLSGYVYIYSIDGSLIKKLTAPDGGADKQFGTSASISNDIVVIGAAYDDDNGIGSGAAYIFYL